jgi:predicted pyridoxine 5'-phosphate oxidase superfamily flavin-nucleotide-binding protein
MPEYPGSKGEHALQESCGTVRRARAFYDHQVLDHLNEEMQAFILRQSLMFIATASADGDCDCSIRAGLPGAFVTVLDENTLVYPEYRGNGVMASLGNMSENPHVGLLFIDFFGSTVGLHVNGNSTIADNEALLSHYLERGSVLRAMLEQGGRRPERWVRVTVAEAYIHCSKHIPQLRPVDKAIDSGTDDAARKGGDYFHAKRENRPWHDRPVPATASTVADREA